MAWYKTKFERHNFIYSPALHQMAEVVFEMDKELNDETVKDFTQEAYKALREQSGWINEHRTVHGGFSSACLSGKFEKIKIPYEDREIERPGPGKPVIACSIKVRGNSYRVTDFYKFEWYTPTPDPIFDKIDPSSSKPRWRCVPCLAEDAQIVSAYGVCGVLEAIDKVKVGELVQWTDISIKQEQGRYADRIANQTEDDIWFANRDMDKKRLVKDLGLVSLE